MRKWLIKQIEKLGLDSSNLKTETELSGYFLKSGEIEQITFPKELSNHGEMRIKEWFFEKGQVVKPGEVIVAVENKKHRLELESLAGGRLNYFLRSGQKVAAGSVIAEIHGVQNNTISSSL